MDGWRRVMTGRWYERISDIFVRPSSGTIEVKLVQREGRMIRWSGTVPGRGRQRTPNRRIVQMISRFVKREAQRSDNPADEGPMEDMAFSEAYPALYEYLTLDVWDDGTSRQTATLLTFCEGCVWKGCLNDRAQERSLWASSVTYDGLLSELDTKLVSGTAEWRRSGQFGKGKNSKKR